MSINKPPNRQPTPDQVDRLLNTMSQELEVRKMEIELRRYEAENERKANSESADIAQLGIKAQAEDLEHERKNKKERARDGYVFAGLMAIAVLTFLGIALYMNKDEIAKTVLTIIGSLGMGWLGGYSQGKAKGEQSRQASLDGSGGEK